MTATIRRYRGSDRAAGYDVCVQTAAAGCVRNWPRTRRTCTSTCSTATGGRVMGGS